jgi:hypothetical protein
MKPATPEKTSINKKTANTVVANEKITEHLFGKENYKWMLVGLIVIAAGFILMVGGKSSDPNVFLEKEVYSVRRITIAPLLIIAGLLIEIFAIMRKPR